MKKLHILANPLRFNRLADAIMPFLVAGAIICIAVALYGGLVLAPPDYLQGQNMRIMYIHVPAAWMAMMIYTVLAGCSASFLIWKHPVADMMARGASGVGAVLTSVALITGMLWGYPSWGTAWVWDARLTSVLVLLLLFLGHMAVLRSFDDVQKSGKFAAILAIIGIINLPIIKFSVNWWNTLHQPASISSFSRMSNPTISMEMLWPLLVMAVGFLCWTIILILIATQAQLLQRRLYMSWQSKDHNGK